jgi:hypothetical protein
MQPPLAAALVQTLRVQLQGIRQVAFQFFIWDRIPVFSSALPRALHPAGVPFPVVVLFTLLQFSLLAGVWAFVTWAGIAGVAFPLLIVSIIPLRMFILPRMFGPYLEKLDEREV